MFMEVLPVKVSGYPTSKVPSVTIDARVTAGIYY
jgi:hypothetical protein